MDIVKGKVEEYLKEVFGGEVKVTSLEEIGGVSGDELKGFGYGKPFMINFSIGEEDRSVVLSSMRGDSFGHDHFSDRAQILIWQHSTFQNLPRHVRSLDAGYFTSSGELRSAGDAQEYFILCEKIEGTEYFLDLERIKSDGITDLDRDRVVALSSYLAEIQSIKNSDEKALYTRRIRDLLGHGECIFGIMDSYPKGLEYISDEELMELEKKCVEWRWKLKDRSERLCMVHGDYHPWNIMFRDGTDFTVLDRSRGEWGEAADDVSSITINYIFYSLYKYGKLDGEFKELFELFFENYLKKTGDEELLSVIQPFFLFRGLVVASPVWYPNIETSMRDKLFNFMKNVISDEKFDFLQVNEYLK